MRIFNKIKIIFVVIVGVTISMISVKNLSAHHFWINSFESFSHKPGHTTVGLGWGHTIPVDDILNSPSGKIIVEKFTITDPKGNVANLRIPLSKIEKPAKKSDNFDVYDSNIGLQKIALKNDSLEGTYLIKANSKPTFYTKYIDTKGRTRLKLKSKDQLKDIKNVLMSVKFQVFAKSYLTLNKWEKQKPLNTELEIIPLDDLSNVRVGNLLEFEVRFKGKPLNFTAASSETIGAFSNTFGQNEGFFLSSYLINGKGQFKVQSKGQWIVHCYHTEQVTKDGVLKNFYGKVDQVVQGATLTFNVK